MADACSAGKESPAMQIRCPHCHHPIEVIVEQMLDELVCPSCGSNVTLISRETTVGGDRTQMGSTIGLEPRRLAHFALLNQVGIGGFGAVWRARDTVLDRVVALKIPRRGQLNSSEAEYFLRDARAAAQLRHPNIVSVHEVGRDGDTFFIASDFIDGADLHEWLSARKLTAREAAELVAEIAEAVQHAHERGVVHRDLKPGNLLMDSDGHPHVTDFGLAKRETGEITMTMDGQILDTPAYMSPEQARGKAHEADAKSDVYSLGVILFELLTGELPFRGEKRMLILQILNDEPPSPGKLNSRVPRDLETICLKCLQKEPKKRYQSAAEMATDLRSFVAGDPIAARPTGRLERGWRWCRRNQIVAGLLAAIVLSLGIGAAASSLFALRARAQLADSYLAQARALRVSRRPGQRFHTLESIQKTMHIKGSSRALADEAVAALCLPDMVPLREWTANLESESKVAVDAALSRYAYSDNQNRVTVRRVADNTEIARITVPEPPVSPHTGLRFSPDGERLHVLCSDRGVTRSHLYALDSAAGRVLVDDGHGNYEFSPDSQRLAVQDADHSIRILDTTTGADLRRYPAPFDEPGQILWHPTKPRLVIGDNNAAWTILDLTTGDFGPVFPLRGDILRWHPNGVEVIAIEMDKDGRQSIRLLDALTGLPTSPPIPASAGGGLMAWTNHSGDLLVTDDWSSKRCLLDLYGGRELLSLWARSQYAFTFGPNDEVAAVTIIGQRMQLLRVASGAEERVVGPGLVNANSGLRQAVLSSDGRLIAAEHVDGLALIDERLGRFVEVIRSTEDLRPLAFERDGALRAYREEKLFRWPMKWSSAGDMLIVSPPEELPVTYVGSASEQSQDGRTIGVANLQNARIFHLGGREIVVETPTLAQHITCCSVSPDGRLLATGSHSTVASGHHACVWDTSTGNLVTIRPSGPHCGVQFSPSGRWLAVSSGIDNRSRLWHVDSWEAGPQFNGESQRAVFSPDESVVAFGSEDVRLYFTETGESFARLVGPEGRQIFPQCFSADGTWLYAQGTGGRSGDSASLYIWDLVKIHAGLEELGLAEEWRDFPPSRKNAPLPRPFRIEFVSE